MADQAVAHAGGGGGGGDEFGDDPKAIWDQKRAAKYLTVGLSTLKGWRSAGTGPEYIRLSSTRVGYRRCDLDAWIESKRYRSTSAESTSTTSS